MDKSGAELIEIVYASAATVPFSPEDLTELLEKALSNEDAQAVHDDPEYSKRILDGDHDVFGDGAVVIKSTPGHTPGHQSLYVNLPESGAVVLSGDLYRETMGIPSCLTSNMEPTHRFVAWKEVFDRTG